MKMTMKAVWAGVLVTATLVPVTVAAQADRTVGSFTINSTKDEISGEVTTIVYSKRPPETHSGTLGVLMFGCRDEAVSPTFYWGRYLMGSRMGRMAADEFVIDVEYRFPSEDKGIAQTWIGQPGHKAAAPSLLFGQTFMPLALNNESVTMRVNDRDGQSLTFKFELRELEQALAELPCKLATTPVEDPGSTKKSN